MEYGAICPILRKECMLEKLRKDVKAMDESFVGQHELKRALVSTMHTHKDLARKRTPNMLILMIIIAPDY